MAQFVVCELCGANLDFGEKCDCQKEKEAAPHHKEQPPKVITSLFSVAQKTKNVKRCRRCKV